MKLLIKTFKSLEIQLDNTKLNHGCKYSFLHCSVDIIIENFNH